MKWIFSILFILFYISGFCSDDTLKYSLSNDFGYLYSKSHNLNFNGENVIYKKKYQFSINTSYSYSNSNHQVDQNELLNKTSLSYNNFFINHIFNISYSRKIHYENFIGFGYVHRFKQPISVSYAVLAQHRQYYYDSIEYKIRHSLRLKLKFKLKIATISFECYYQPNFNKMNDYIIYGNSKLIMFENRKISLTFSDNLNYQSISPIKTVHSFSVGIGVNFIKK